VSSGRCNTTHDQVALANSRCPRTRSIPSLRGAGSAPDRVALLPLSSRGCRANNARTQNREPLHSRREVHPSEVGGWRDRVQATHYSCLTSCCAQVGSERVEDANVAHANVRHCVEPQLVVSRTPHCHPPGPHRVGTTRYVRAMGRRPSRSATRRSLRNAGASVTHPAKGEILVEIEVPSVRSTMSPTRG
jgi:hypothetical protein